MPEATTTLIPYIVCRSASEAVAFYEKAFGAETAAIHRLLDGRIVHAALNIRGAVFFLMDAFPEHGSGSPLELGGSPVTLHLQVPDCDAVFGRAVEAGCAVGMPLEDMFWGDRYGMVTDPYGHKWGIATTVRQVSTEEINEALAADAG